MAEAIAAAGAEDRRDRELGRAGEGRRRHDDRLDGVDPDARASTPNESANAKAATAIGSDLPRAVAVASGAHASGPSRG